MINQNRIRYAVIGAGNIAQMAVLPAFEHAKKNSQLVALISSDPEKRAELSKKYNIQLTGDFTELEGILKSGAVDAVYVATPNALHKAHVLLAARCKVHVLCEKPLAASVADAQEMADACRQASVKLMTAYRLHFEEANLKASELVKSGKIGDPRVFDSVLTHVVRPGDIRTQPEMGGGAMLDLGIYCVNAARNLLRDEPTLAFAVSRMVNGVDDTTTAILQFPHGRVAHFTVSSSIAGVSSFRVSGTDGNLHVEPAYEYSDKLEHHLTVNEEKSHESFRKRDQFAPELEYFSRCILEDREPEPNATEAICDLRVVEAILESAASGKPIPLEPHQRARRPSPAQEQQKPPVSKQKPIHAPSPSLK